MSQDDAVKRNARQSLRAVVVALLGCGQERMQHLDRCLEHLDEFHQAAVAAAQTAGEAVCIRVVLGEMLELPDVDFADQGRDVLVVLIPRLRLGDSDLVENGWPQLHHLELGDVAAVLLETLRCPRGNDPAQVALRNTVVFLEDRAVFAGIEQR